MLIDTHAHLYLKQFDEDLTEVINRAKAAGVQKVYLPNIDQASIESMLRLEKSHPDFFFPMMGLHPCSVKADYKEELKIVKGWLDRRPFCAVGEIGIDLYWDKTFVKEQQDAFLTQARWAVDLDVPIVIHSRESTDMIIELLRENWIDGLRGIFHCFGGSVEQAKAIIDLGFYLGIGGVLTFKKSGLDKTLKEVSLEHLVLETDSPYLAPTPYRGKRNESAYTRLVAEKLALVKDLSLEEVMQKTTENALKIFVREPENSQ
ncbi:MAG: TatD family hydrolase [Bacteroidota bacterium]